MNTLFRPLTKEELEQRKKMDEILKLHGRKPPKITEWGVPYFPSDHEQEPE